MTLNNLEDLSHSENRAVIINYNTKLVSTLSLLSALKYADMPVLLIDCESTDGSLSHFQKLSEQYDFDLLSVPLRNHGVTLDWLFPKIKAEYVLLIDSDLEILDNEIIQFFQRYMIDHQVFGAGFMNGPGILNSEEFENTPIFNGLYFERPWMPLVYLRKSAIVEALNWGISFAELQVRKSWLPALFGKSKKKYSRAYHGSLIKSHRTVYYDTGALIYDFLRYRKHYFFASIPEPLHYLHTRHFFGTTRKVVNENDNNNGGGIVGIEEEVRKKLFEKYGYSEA